DSLGNETELPVRDWIDVGVYAADSLVYHARQRFDANRRTFRVTVPQRPDSAGIDPQHKLIDRRLSDNVRTVDAAPAARRAPGPAARPPSGVRPANGDTARPPRGVRPPSP
ncbi:MAG: hypothetical protein ACJ8GN_20840, partial [Longimicrobiaceae bacterium]